MPFDGTIETTDPIAQILIDARARLERGWCTHSGGKDAYGNPVQGHDPRAVQWCLFGAILAAEPLSNEKRGMALDIVATHLPVPYTNAAGIAAGIVAIFNNAQTSVEPVLAVVDLAIEAVLGRVNA